jgi:hypothetical protein
MSIEATINVTAHWLCKTHPVVFTNRQKDQPLLADPFPMFQMCVKDNAAFFKDEHGYMPDPTSRTGLAGVRSRIYTKVWRDHVILEALRIYRARTEGASLDTVPAVTYSRKPAPDGRADKTVAQRGIMGFEPRAARQGYIYNPERNPNGFLTDLPIDKETCLLPYDQAADVWIGAMEADWIDEMEKKYIARAHDAAAILPVDNSVAAKRKIYMCSTCHVAKKGHVCPAPKKRKGAVVKRAGKRARK